MVAKMTAYKILMGNSKGNRSLGRLRSGRIILK
jgi:hypothetical protein